VTDLKQKAICVIRGTAYSGHVIGGYFYYADGDRIALASCRDVKLMDEFGNTIATKEDGKWNI